LIDRGVCLRESGFELVDVSPQPFDLRCFRVGRLPAALHLLEALLELDAQVCVGPIAVEGGAVDAGGSGEGLDIAVAVGRQLAAQSPVHRCPDAVLVLDALGGTDSHGSASVSCAVLAASISPMMGRARW
jgi:hypothetical protein